jgi:hypothetical protein
MELLEAIEQRHAVRAYQDTPLTDAQKAELRESIRRCNRAGGLHIQLVTDEPRAFSGLMARYGKFSGVRNYIALIGRPGPDFEEKCGYYGEKLALRAQQLGLNTCWVGLTYAKVKDAYRLEPGEKLALVITLGVGRTQGTPHRARSREEVMRVSGPVPAWFLRGVDAALLAPTAMNQQKFVFTLDGDTVAAASLGGPYAQVDLGIVKYHFELGAGVNHFKWA